MDIMNKNQDMLNKCLDPRIDSLYRIMTNLTTSEISSHNKVFNKIREFDNYRENFWDELEKKHNVNCLYLVPDWEKKMLKIVKKHKELFQWLKNWQFNHCVGNKNGKMYMAAYTYLISTMGFMDRWDEV